MKLNKKIDWITATQTAKSFDDLKPILPTWCEMGEATKPPPRFDRAWKLSPAGILALSENGTMCQLVQWTGQELEQIREKAQATDEQILQHICATCNNVTRIDYAVDVLETDSSPLDFLQRWEAGTLNTRFRTVQHYRTLTGFRGETVYFGSKSSPQRIRIYDKAAEQKLLQVAWTRVELQARKKKATPLANDMAKHGVVASGDTRLRELLKPDECQWWDAATAGEDVELTQTPRNEPAWQKWMNGQVLRSIENHVGSSDERKFMNEWLDKVADIIVAGYASEHFNVS